MKNEWNFHRRNPEMLLVWACYIWCIFISSCALTPEQLQTVQINALKDVRAAGIGYLQGGQAGAATGLTAQILMNHAPLTSAKNPRKVTK